jgi:hypothetical protein
MRGKTFSFFVISSILILLVLPSEGRQDSTKELELKFSFPDQKLEEKDIFLYQARSFSADREGNTYIVSMGDNKILKFDKNGEFIRKIGRSGQGPGEFQGPNHVIPWQDKVYVLDNFSLVFQIFDADGVYKNSFRVPKPGWGMALSGKGLICVSPFLNPQEKNIQLINIFSQEGELIKSFGQPKDFNRGFNVFNITNLAINNEDELLVAFRFWPEIRKYTLDGKLKNTYTIDHKMMRENAGFNSQQQKPPKKAGMGIMTRDAITDMEIDKNTIYLLHKIFSEPKIEILELDNNMKIKNTYFYENADGFGTEDFFVKENDEELQFYILQTYPENRVAVLKVKK